MAFGLRLLKFAAKVGLDLLIGSTRTDEAVALFSEWWSQNDAGSRNQELTEAKEAASDSHHLQEIVMETVAAKGGSVLPDQIEALTLSLSSGFTALPDQLGADPSAAKFLAERVLPRWAGEWESLPPATRRPRPGSQAAKLFDCLGGTPASYRQLWQRAGFDKDPFLRTTLRKWAKAGWVDRTIDADGSTELWSVPAAETGQENEQKKGTS